MSQTFQLTLNLEWSEKSLEKCYKMFLPKLMEL